jgi:hypothetical protein
LKVSLWNHEKGNKTPERKFISRVLLPFNVSSTGNTLGEISLNQFLRIDKVCYDGRDNIGCLPCIFNGYSQE